MREGENAKGKGRGRESELIQRGKKAEGRREGERDLTALPVMLAISFSLANTPETVSFGGANIILWLLRLDCKSQTQ